MKRTNKNLIIGCIILITLSIGLYLSLAFYIRIKIDIDTKTQSDTIIILGAKAYHGNSYSPCLVSRVSDSKFSNNYI